MNKEIFVDGAKIKRDALILVEKYISRPVLRIMPLRAARWGHSTKIPTALFEKLFKKKIVFASFCFGYYFLNINN